MNKTTVTSIITDARTTQAPRVMRISLPAPTFTLDITHDRSETAPPNRIIRTDAPPPVKGPSPYHLSEG